MKPNRRALGGPSRASPRRTGGLRSERHAEAAPSTVPAGAGRGLWIVLVAAPLVIFGVILALESRKPMVPTAPVVLEEEEYEESKRLQERAQTHISGFFRAKRNGDSQAMDAEFRRAKENLESAQTILERLKMRYTDDGTLEGNLPDDYYYLDQELAKLSEDYIQILREKDVGE